MRVFFEIFRKFQRHCFAFFRDMSRPGPRHLLVINPMRAVRRGGCDTTVALVTMVVAATTDISSGRLRIYQLSV